VKRAQLLKELELTLPPTEARALLAFALGESTPELFAKLDEPLSKSELARVEELFKRRRRGEPLGLILGEVEFLGLKLKVRPGVFLPRPETEGLVELALKSLEEKTAPRVLDVGTGSGAIALAIKSARKDAEVYASDINERALALARENARALGLEVTFLKAPLTAGVDDLDLIVANPPYLPESYRESAPPELAYEPEEALFAGEDGLAVARPLLHEAKSALRPGGSLLLELDPTNAALLAREAIGLGFSSVHVLPDLAKRPRYLLARAPAAEAAG